MIVTELHSLIVFLHTASFFSVTHHDQVDFIYHSEKNGNIIDYNVVLTMTVKLFNCLIEVID